jgi:zinc protease
MFRTLFRRAACAGAIAVSVLAPALAGAAFDPGAPVPPGPEVKVGKLPNGLTYYIRRHARPAHRLELRLMVKAGSVLEDEDQQGLAHFVEHMAFNGSTHFRKHELVSWLQSIGVRFGGDMNAATSFDVTTYILPVPTQRSEDVDKAFTILEDWAHGVSFEDADIEKERAIVLEEARLHRNADERIEKAVFPRLYPGSRHGARFPIGKEEVLRTFKPETLRRFYRDWYRPDLMAVVAVGDIDPPEAERQIVARFGGLRNPVPERERRWDEAAPRTGTDVLVVTDPEVTAERLSIAYSPRFAPDPGTYGSFREHLVARLADRMVGARLAELAQGTNPPFISAASSELLLAARYHTRDFTAVLGPGGSAPALAALAQEQRRLRRDGFGADELNLARDALMAHYNGYYQERDTAESAVYAAEYLRNFLLNETIPGVEAEYRMVQQMLPAITLDELNAWVRTTMPAGPDRLITYVGAGRTDAVPDRERLLAQAAEADRSEAPPRRHRVLASQLMTRPSRPGSIVAESRDDALGLSSLTLSNGVKVVLKPTSFPGYVQLAAQRFGGEALFGAEDVVNARVAGALADTMGLKDASAFDLQRMTATTGASVNLSLGVGTDDIAGWSGTGAADIEAMLQLLWLRFAGVPRDEAAFRAWMGREEMLLRQRDAQPALRFEDALADSLYASHPRAPRSLLPADLARIDLDRSLSGWRQRFSSARGFTFLLVGNFDMDAVKPLLAAYLGTLPTAEIEVGYRDNGVRFARGVVKRELHAGTEPKSIVSLNFSGAARWSPEEELRQDAVVEVMRLRVDEVLREKLGLIYSAQLSGAIYATPGENSYLINATMPTAPENAERVEQALMAEIERLKRDGPEPAELEKVRQTWRQEWARHEQNNWFWIKLMKIAVLQGIDPQRYLNRVQRAAALTPADVREAARRYLDTGNYVEVVLKPEMSKADAKPVVATALAPR